MSHINRTDAIEKGQIYKFFLPDSFIDFWLKKVKIEKESQRYARMEWKSYVGVAQRPYV
jgi:hypothetical protein